MSTTSGGPNIVTNGLVLHLDAANTKSFRGEPTTNLANTDSSRTIQQHNPGGYGNAATMTDAPERGTGWKKITITNRGNNLRIAQFPYITQPTGTTRTYSLDVDMNNNSSYYWSIDGFGGYGAINIVGGKVVTTITTTTNSGPLAMFLNNNTTGVSGINDTIYYRYYQVEDKAYATTFTETSRGTTVATGGGWADRTINANHGELVNGPTFSSANGGSIVFDGVDDVILTSTNVINTVSDFTLEIVIKYNSSTPLYNSFFGYGKSPDSNANFGFMIANPANYVLLSDGTNRTFGAVVSGLQNNTIYHLTYIIKSDGNTSSYINGLLYNTDIPDSGFTTIKVDSSFVFALGKDVRYTNGSVDRHFLGGIYLCKLYNRALSAQEILQNYNAQKSRFGLP